MVRAHYLHLRLHASDSVPVEISKPVDSHRVVITPQQLKIFSTYVHVEQMYGKTSIIVPRLEIRCVLCTYVNLILLDNTNYE